MSSKIENKSKLNNKNKQISIDNIVVKLNDLQLVKSKSSSKIDSNKNKPKTNTLSRKDIAVKVYDILEELENVVGKDEEKIKDLYNRLKAKLGEDIYIVNIGIVSNFLKDEKNAKRLNKTIMLLFDNIRIDIEVLLKNFLSENDFKILEDITGYETESELTQLINSILGTTENKDKINRLAYIYLYLLVKNYAKNYFRKQLFEIEVVLMEFLADFKKLEKNKYLLKNLPESFLSDNPEERIRNSAHLYFLDQNKELKESVRSLTIRLEDSNELRDKLSDDVRQLIKDGSEKDELISNLEKGVEDKIGEITSLKEELETAKGRHTFEINKLERLLQNFRTQFKTNINKKLKNELEDIAIIANRLDNQNSTSLKMALKNINQLLNNN